MGEDQAMTIEELREAMAVRWKRRLMRGLDPGLAAVYINDARFVRDGNFTVCLVTWESTTGRTYREVGVAKRNPVDQDDEARGTWLSFERAFEKAERAFNLTNHQQTTATYGNAP